MGLDGRTRASPPAASSSVHALLSAITPSHIPPPPPLPSAAPIASLLSLPPTPARVIAPSPAYPSPSSTHVVPKSSSASTDVVLALSLPSTPPVLSQVITPLRRTHPFPPVLDLFPAPFTYTERQRDVAQRHTASIASSSLHCTRRTMQVCCLPFACSSSRSRQCSPHLESLKRRRCAHTAVRCPPTDDLLA